MSSNRRDPVKSSTRPPGAPGSASAAATLPCAGGSREAAHDLDVAVGPAQGLQVISGRFETRCHDSPVGEHHGLGIPSHDRRGLPQLGGRFHLLGRWNDDDHDGRGAGIADSRLTRSHRVARIRSLREECLPDVEFEAGVLERPGGFRPFLTEIELEMARDRSRSDQKSADGAEKTLPPHGSVNRRANLGT